MLDVAGGKGDVAFELLNLNNIPATLVEPRPRCLHKRLLWLQVVPASILIASCEALRVKLHLGHGCRNAMLHATISGCISYRGPEETIWCLIRRASTTAIACTSAM